VGFEIAPEHRGHSFAYYACRALAPFIARHRDDVILTCDPENAPSIRTIEKLGAEFIEEVSVAPHDPGYVNGARQKKRYSWRVVAFHEHGAR
jgi:tagatose 1,6-diphosphate aldolase